MAWKTNGGSGGGGGGATAGGNTQMSIVGTGALTANVTKSVAHNLVGCTKFSFFAFYGTNEAAVQILEADPAKPYANFIVQVGVNLAGLTIRCFGSPLSTPIAINEASGNTTGAAVNATAGILTITGIFAAAPITRALCFTWLDKATGLSTNFPVTTNVLTQTVTVNIGTPLPALNQYTWDLTYI
jgi:hypothetical protein